MFSCYSCKGYCCPNMISNHLFWSVTICYEMCEKWIFWLLFLAWKLFKFLENSGIFLENCLKFLRNFWNIHIKFLKIVDKCWNFWNSQKKLLEISSKFLKNAEKFFENSRKILRKLLEILWNILKFLENFRKFLKIV